MKRRNKFIASLLASIAASAANAADALDEVVVLGTRLEESLPQELAKYGNRIEVISAEQLSASGFDDVTQALQMLAPGLFVSPKNGAFDYINSSLQGSRSSEILWLVDGVRISNRLYNSTTPLDTLPVNVVERIEILKGGQGIFYGTQSLAGVVNVITKGYSRNLDLGVGLGTDTHSGKHANARISDEIAGISYVAYASYDKADGFDSFRAGDREPSSTDRKRGYDVRTAGAKVAHTFVDVLTADVHYQYTDATLDYAYPTDHRFAFNERKEQLISGKLDWRAMQGLDVYLKFYYHEWVSHWSEADFSGAYLYDRAFWGYQDYGFNLMSKIQLGTSLELLTGIDTQNYNGRDDVLIIAPLTERVTAFFGQIRSSEAWSAKTKFALGLRYNDAKDTDGATVWSVSGEHRFTDSWYLRGLANTSFRLPDAYELYANDPCCALGNPKLRPESGRNFEIATGATAIDDILELEVALFHRRVSNFISDAGAVVENIDRLVTTRGLEAIATLRVGKDWHASLDYTAARTRSSGSSLQEPHIPEEMVKASVSYRAPGDRFGLSASGIYVGDVYQVVRGERIEYGGYVVGDLSGDLKLDDSGMHRISLRIENVFDTEYTTQLGGATRDAGAPYVYRSIGTPRTLHLGYTFRFDGR